MFPRKLENFYTHSRYIAEFWNTISNLPFIIIGFLRLSESNIFQVNILYFFFMMAGLCSAYHHSHPKKWTIIIDWIPISISIGLCFRYSIFQYLSWISIFKLSIAFWSLITDHIWTPVNVPWGHVFWHILA